MKMGDSVDASISFEYYDTYSEGLTKNAVKTTTLMALFLSDFFLRIL
jgi:hypothetical protein